MVIAMTETHRDHDTGSIFTKLESVGRQNKYLWGQVEWKAVDKETGESGQWQK
jgi:hypothetical protein